MFNAKFSRLIRQGFLTEKEFLYSIGESSVATKSPEDILMSMHIPKHERLFCVPEYYGYPFAESDENLMVSPGNRLDGSLKIQLFGRSRYNAFSSRSINGSGWTCL